ncbi:hypothetical protein OPV22_024624 [Ensete ventricosum]|uniref:Chromosome transmission fidelity protein 8 n=1 Tax=Ensete ventricosum TaxID=4639 RepID=A0AAV8P6K1_ENSVE|nr:hypothetical protein OPV22_024624 [Ensete ventricosum]
MQIRVKCNCGDGKCPEWAIVELQGVVESQLATSDQINGLEIGHLCCPSLSSSSSQPSYTFTVGYHELSGTKVQLKKPLLVLKKKAATQSTDITATGKETFIIRQPSKDQILDSEVTTIWESIKRRRKKGVEAFGRKITSS